MDQFQELAVEKLFPFNANRIMMQCGIMYANPWVGLVTGGPITFTAAEFLVGGITAFYNSYVNEVTWPSVDDIATELGMSDVIGYAFDYFVANNSTDPLIIHLGAGMSNTSAISGANNMTIPAQSAGSFRIIGYWDGANNAMKVSRIS